MTIRGTDGHTILSETQGKNFYFQLFACHQILRPACHRCQYASFHRPGDFSLGDFWGIENHFPEFDDNKGTSLVMINTEMGEKIWQQIRKKTDAFAVSMEQCAQPNLIRPSEEDPWRAVFWRRYHRYGLNRVGQMMGWLPAGRVEKLLLFLYLCEDKLNSLLGKKSS